MLAIAVAITRIWTRFYTSGLPAAVREGRREEVACDVWEQRWLAARRGDPALGTTIEVLARMLLGVASDISWRAQASASTRADRRIKVSEPWYRRALIPAGVVLALFLILSGMVGIVWFLALVIAVPIGIAIVTMAFLRARRTGGSVGIGVNDMRTRGENHRKWLLLIIGVSVATLVGMSAYAFSLEEWGEARTMIFNLGGLLAVTAGLVALVLLISDLMGSARRKTDS